jgi:hypothetical protein
MHINFFDKLKFKKIHFDLSFSQCHFVIFEIFFAIFLFE